MMLQALVQPYESTWMNVLDVVSLTVLIFTQVLSILYLYLDTMEAPLYTFMKKERVELVVTIVLFIANLSVIATLMVVWIGRLLWEKLTHMKERAKKLETSGGGDDAFGGPEIQMQALARARPSYQQQANPLVARRRKAEEQRSGAGLAIVDEEKEAMTAEIEAMAAEIEALKMELALSQQPRTGRRRKAGSRAKPVTSTFARENPMAAGDTAMGGMGVMRTGQTWNADAQEDDSVAAEQEGPVTFIAANPMMPGGGTSGEEATPMKGRTTTRRKGRRKRTTLGSERGRSRTDESGGSIVIDVHDNPMAETQQRGPSVAARRRAERTAERRAAKEARAARLPPDTTTINDTDSDY